MEGETSACVECEFLAKEELLISGVFDFFLLSLVGLMALLPKDRRIKDAVLLPVVVL
jgi:hypothetical protein